MHRGLNCEDASLGSCLLDVGQGTEVLKYSGAGRRRPDLTSDVCLLVK